MSEIHVDSSGENTAGKSRPVSSIYEQALGRMHYNLSPESSLDGPEAMIPLGSNVPWKCLSVMTFRVSPELSRR